MAMSYQLPQEEEDEATDPEADQHTQIVLSLVVMVMEFYASRFTSRND